jgi:hypothetical protein
MKKSKFTESQIIKILKESEAGRNAAAYKMTNQINE